MNSHTSPTAAETAPPPPTTPTTTVPSSYTSLSSSVSNRQHQHDANSASSQNDASTLPSHLKLEFDKMKYLPDMVKTIKKRHSISEIEGSGNTIPPMIVQKLLERHKELNNNNNNCSSSNSQR